MSTYFCFTRKEFMTAFRDELKGIRKEYPNMSLETFQKYAYWLIEEDGMGTSLGLKVNLTREKIDKISIKIFKLPLDK